MKKVYDLQIKLVTIFEGRALAIRQVCHQSITYNKNEINVDSNNSTN